MHGLRIHTKYKEKWKAKKKAEKFRFIGYSLQTKGYRLIDNDTSKVIVRRDVIFNESDFQQESRNEDDNGKGGEVSQDEVDEHDPTAEEQPTPPNEQEPEDRYPKRHRTVPVRYGIDEYVDIAFSGGEEPQNINEALESRKSLQWKEAADSEYQSLMGNQTWELVNLPSGRKSIGCRWVFKTKYGVTGS